MPLLKTFNFTERRWDIFVINDQLSGWTSFVFSPENIGQSANEENVFVPNEFIRQPNQYD